MTALMWTLGVYAVAFALHVLWWRVHKPVRQREVIVIWFGLVFLAASAILVHMGSQLPTPAWWLPIGLVTYAHMAVWYGSMVLAYLAIYVALDGDSPSLTMARMIDKAGPAGLPEDALKAVMTQDKYLRSRLAKLLHDGMVRECNGRYYMEHKGMSLLRFFLWYRCAVNEQDKAA